MHEGWSGDDYVVLFDESEATTASVRYGICVDLPGFSIVGLYAWNDFIVKDPGGRLFTVPTVPLSTKYLADFDLDIEPSGLAPDQRFTGRIKWYVKPLILGGDPNAEDNVIWIDHDKHSQLVRWWNGQVRSIQSSDDA